MALSPTLGDCSVVLGDKIPMLFSIVAATDISEQDTP